MKLCVCVCVCVWVCVCARACALMLEDVVGGDWETGRVDREMENIPLGGTFPVKYCWDIQ